MAVEVDELEVEELELELELLVEVDGFEAAVELPGWLGTDAPDVEIPL